MVPVCACTLPGRSMTKAGKFPIRPRHLRTNPDRFAGAILSSHFILLPPSITVTITSPLEAHFGCRITSGGGIADRNSPHPIERAWHGVAVVTTETPCVGLPRSIGELIVKLSI